MKNITVSVDEEVYHRARMKAAERKTTVSALVKSFLAEVVEEQELRAALHAEGNALSTSENLSRDSLYDRDETQKQQSSSRNPMHCRVVRRRPEFSEI